MPVPPTNGDSAGLDAMLPPQLMLVAMIGLFACCILCSACATFLSWKYVLPQWRVSSQRHEKSHQPGDSEDDVTDDDERRRVVLDGIIQNFLDPAWLQGLDDSPELEINPVLKYRVAEDKRAAVRAAAEAAGDGKGTGNPLRGVPGAISRLQWSLDGTGKGPSEESRNKEKRRTMKNIEG